MCNDDDLYIQITFTSYFLSKTDGYLSVYGIASVAQKLDKLPEETTEFVSFYKNECNKPKEQKMSKISRCP
jgi:hypothetical protein